ncbi:MAG: hypothetical protein LLF94_10765 [Chlamydiales bacterium]|nr:hypothetical protein [Chlamydiales bacterium]
MQSLSSCTVVEQFARFTLDSTTPSPLASLDQKIDEFCHELFVRRTQRKDEVSARFIDDEHVVSICGELTDANRKFVQELVNHPHFLGSLRDKDVNFILNGQRAQKGILYLVEEWIPRDLCDSCSPKDLSAELKYSFVNNCGFIDHVILKPGQKIPSDTLLAVDLHIENNPYFKGFGRFNLLRIQALSTCRVAKKIIKCCTSITHDELDPAPILKNLVRKKLPTDRYIDVVPPYTMNCVAVGSHDIHGSYVRAGGRLFIACQGPRKDVVNAFWQTVLHHGTESIIALGPDNERQTEKFYSGYFTFKDTLVLEEGLTVKKAADDTAIDWDFVVPDLKVSPKTVKHSIMSRTFELTSPKFGTRIVRHHHCPTWQDMKGGDCRILTELIKCIDATPAAPNKPVIVHCSAGIGRTGTLITGYEIHHAKQPINLLATILQQRHARYGMVQSKEQVEMLLRFMKA